MAKTETTMLREKCVSVFANRIVQDMPTGQGGGKKGEVYHVQALSADTSGFMVAALIVDNQTGLAVAGCDGCIPELQQCRLRSVSLNVECNACRTVVQGRVDRCSDVSAHSERVRSAERASAETHYARSPRRARLSAPLRLEPSAFSALERRAPRSRLGRSTANLTANYNTSSKAIPISSLLLHSASQDLLLTLLESVLGGASETSSKVLLHYNLVLVVTIICSKMKDVSR